MGVMWTEEQKKVIDLRQRNILVSAAAGSGKTAVLVERIITMLTDAVNPVSVDRLLIVTFTEAAAAEMKERIRTAIEKKLEEYPDDAHLEQQATLIHNAQITTIHSFCLSVIRDYFHMIDIDPGFRIGEEGELRLLRQDVLEKLLEEHYDSGEREFLDFVSAYGGGRDDKKIEELILKIYEFSRSYPDAEGWLDACRKAYRVQTKGELESSIYVRLVCENVRRYLADAKKLLEQGLALCREADGPSAYEAALGSDSQMIGELLKLDSFEALNERMREISWMRLGANRDKNVSEEKASQVKMLRDEVKELVGDMISQYFYQDTEGFLEDLRLCAPQMEALAGLVREFSERFEAEKRKKEMIDFSDMEQYALQILTERDGDKFVPSAAAKEYQRQFAEIMIDEYQDSNLLQETILTSISTVSEGKYNVFMVGDVKQSIYRFRLSRPELFMEKFDTYSLEDGDRQRIDLHKNFRSRREVLDSINYIFRQIMTRGLGGIAYDDAAALYTGADYKENKSAKGNGNRTEVLVIDTDMEKTQKYDAISERELEARVIAGRIRELMRDFQVVDKGTGQLRPLKYSDIVILIRSLRGFADTFTEVLMREGIPACAGTREGYFAAQEIGVLLDYLKVLNNRRQDIPLAAVLHSPFCGLTEEELAVVKNENHLLPFHQAVCKYREEGRDDGIRGKLEACLKQMDRFQKIAPYTPMHELLRKIFADTGYEDFMSAMPGGMQRRANLEMLIERAKSFESTSYKGLFHFIRYIEQLQKYNVDYGEAGIEDEQADTVRILTIHKSKGLEFPVVFAAGMGKRFNMQDVRSSAVLHVKLGVGLDAVDTLRRTKSPSIIKRIIQKEEALDSLGEELRVLYVAFTRAKEKLILTGTISNLEKKITSYGVIRGQKPEELSFGLISRAVTYWDWILPSLMRLTEDIPIRFCQVAFEDIVREEAAEETASHIKRAVLENWDTEKEYEPKVRRMLEEQFGFRYPYEGGRTQRFKFTVSELKKRAYLAEAAAEAEDGELLYEEPDVVPLLPRFLKEEEELAGASRGTAYHRLLELLDFSLDYTEETILSLTGVFCSEGKMSEEMADCICVEDIMKFLKSPVGRRLKESAVRGGLKKEQPFVIGIDAKQVYPQEQEGEKLLVQGIIDVYFEEQDGLVVLDYKTDKIYKEEKLAEKYHAQLDYYAQALEQMTHKKVKEKLIYSFTLGREIRV